MTKKYRPRGEFAEIYNAVRNIERGLGISPREPHTHDPDSLDGIVERLQTGTVQAYNLKFDRDMSAKDAREREQEIKRLQKEICWMQYKQTQPRDKST